MKNLLKDLDYDKKTILRGFNPEPSIIRVGKDYYIATSTFEWFPGVQINGGFYFVQTRAN